ncbi:MAG: nucleotidyltransferase family protein [Alphaproteobacteria bacterium]|nr:nucleotidyltransferase family protein [Alphaproteobacteria bacterium]
MIPAIILAGGFGTRLRPVLPDTPKALAPVGGRPFLAHQIDWLAEQGVTRVVLAVHHLAEQIEAFARSVTGVRPGVHIDIVRETEPLGTGGAIVNAIARAAIDGDVLVVNGDTHFSFALAPVLDKHRTASATLVAARVADVARFGTVLLDGDRVTGFLQASGDRQPGLVNAGAYVFHPSVFADAPSGAFSLEKDFFPALAARGGLHAHVIDGAEAFFDIGTPESYAAFRSRDPAP